VAISGLECEVSDNTKFGPPKGMRDWLPQETLLRQKLIRLIESHYQLYGFQPIDTPVMENIEVLQGKGGGENEKLMFKIEKRGDELSAVIQTFVDGTTTAGEAQAEAQLKLRNTMADMGLRFDLTVPLARYYANHSNELPKPFRCYHIGPVWRADRPQKGRYREFYQCDIDIIGGAADSYEVELLLATDRVLKELNVGKFKIRISDKGLLPALLTGMGVDPSKVSGVAVALDKLDKQPYEQVRKEIENLGHSLEVLNKVDAFIQGSLHKKLEPAHYKIGQVEALWAKIDSIRQRVHAVNPDANVVFDPLLVRGFDYYTGPVFEINVEDKDFTFSIGGGGRYDGLIEKLGGPKGTPAVGISLGFERILLILAEKYKSATQAHLPRVFIVNNGQPEKDILTLAEELRSEGIQVETSLENKKIGQQLEAAQKNGIEYAITEFQPGHKSYKVRQLSTRQDKEMTLAELYDVMKRLSEGVED
jgi:histidyl-tRNA synthetase